jgi:hypothetical protein
MLRDDPRVLGRRAFTRLRPALEIFKGKVGQRIAAVLVRDRIAAQGDLAQLFERELTGVGDAQHRIRRECQPLIAAMYAKGEVPDLSPARRDPQAQSAHVVVVVRDLPSRRRLYGLDELRCQV